jgi:hypothetical protein
LNDRAVLSSLVRFDRPLAELEQALADLEPQGKPGATLTRKDITGVVRRHLAGLIGAQEVARWASLVESREDIEFEPRQEPAVADAIFDLANPDLQGALAAIAPDVLASLEG